MSQKLPNEFENPFDICFIKLSDWLSEKMYPHFTPNMITTIGNVFRIASLYFLFTKKKLWFFICAIIGYFFDCLDGHYARKYKMVSHFGDLYDHASDTIYNGILLYYLLFYTKSKYKNWIVGLFFIVLFIQFIHLGCQEIYYTDESSNTLKPFRMLCKNKEWMSITRYFGCGTCLPLLYFLIYYF